MHPIFFWHPFHQCAVFKMFKYFYSCCNYQNCLCSDTDISLCCRCCMNMNKVPQNDWSRFDMSASPSVTLYSCSHSLYSTLDKTLMKTNKQWGQGRYRGRPPHTFLGFIVCYFSLRLCLTKENIFPLQNKQAEICSIAWHDMCTNWVSWNACLTLMMFSCVFKNENTVRHLSLTRSTTGDDVQWTADGLLLSTCNFWVRNADLQRRPLCIFDGTVSNVIVNAVMHHCHYVRCVDANEEH